MPIKDVGKIKQKLHTLQLAYREGTLRARTHHQNIQCRTMQIHFFNVHLKRELLNKDSKDSSRKRNIFLESDRKELKGRLQLR